ncbi:alpha/beta hydrolase family protein [Nonomuraea rhodomycinica]|uniref:Alpha/beta hydrolase n=1 Tax=Nonomuraea rhodomycinica TaxID=1712872 RepID=A0A7Y6MGE3_9ACTN|nr:alpha/beta hydrolase [Nonomuraea rhodomycinica]NUW46877.1 alpha/beta hydrolase [Nonomuraea rhodomycinica]
MAGSTAPGQIETFRYGPHPDQIADVTLPTRATGAAPLVMLLHGGFWRAAHDRLHVRVVADALTSEGYAVANVEYRRVGGGGGWPATFMDVAQAADTLPALIERSRPGRLDLDRTVYLGHSAGGQLAVWAALRDRLPQAAPGRTAVPPRVAGVVALAPVVDLAGTYALGDGGGPVADLLGGGPGDVPERYAAADPAALGASPAPVIVVHGDLDEVLPVDLSRRYHASCGGKLIEVPGAGHFDLIDPRSAAWPSVLEALRLLANA